jgi:uncharacterized protein (TIRG00374 family)
LIAEKQTVIGSKQAAVDKIWPWLNIVLTLVLAGFGGWFLTRKVGLAAIWAAFTAAKPEFIILSLMFVLAIIVIKAWRWALLLRSDGYQPSVKPLFWATMLGHYVNLLVPLLRLGEIARIYALHRQTGTSNMKALGTLVVEKALDMIMILLAMGILLPIITLPDFMDRPGLALALITLAVLVALYLLAFEAKFIVRFVTTLANRLPEPVARRVVGMAVAGLDGLSGLRNKKISLALVVLSALLAFLSILPPYFLLRALDIPLGLTEAALINLVVTIALTPPSTPAKIGVFDGTVAFMLLRLGISDNAQVASYTIVFHLVAVLPLILLGSIAASRTNWHWNRYTRNGQDSQ